ncbi:MAG: TldD/PmbA family protein, partial [Bacteroidota bacterium]
ITEGVGIRVINGERTGYAYSDDLSLSQLLEAAGVAAYVADGRASSCTVDLTKKQVRPLQTISIPAADVDATKKVELLTRADETARTFDRRVQEVNCGYGDSRKFVMVANSDGDWAEHEEQLFRLSMSVLALDDGKRDSATEFLGGRYGFEYFDEHTPEEAAKKAAGKALMKLHARPAPAGQFPVLIEAGWGGVIVHEAVGHGLEGDVNRKGTSVYAGKLGEKVATEAVTIIDDGTVPHARGSLPIDDEGTLTQRTVLIDQGILVGFMYDKLNARLMNTQSTGNGRRESFHHIPLPRMRNTFIEAGDDSPHAMLRSVKKGIYAKSLGGGQVDTVNGSFVFEISEGYLIEHGEVSYPIRGANLIGNGPEVMNKVVGVGDNLEIEKRTGSCGKDGQYVPVGVGQPTILVSEMTVGGTDV